MLFNVLTGALAVCLVILCLLYPLRRKFKNTVKMNKLKFHCISGYLLLIASFVHIRLFLFSPHLSIGLISFLSLLSVTLTGFIKRRFMKSRLLYAIHVISVVIFILAIVAHIFQQIVNILFM